MGDKDFVKPILERRGQVHFGKVHALQLLFLQSVADDLRGLAKGWSIPTAGPIERRTFTGEMTSRCHSESRCAGENEAGKATDIRHPQGSCRSGPETGAGFRAPGEPSQQHRHLQPRGPPRAEENCGLEGKLLGTALECDRERVPGW